MLKGVNQWYNLRYNYWKGQEVTETSGGRPKLEKPGSSYLHLLSFDNILVVVSRRGQPHVAERQLPLWLPTVMRWKGQHRWVNDHKKKS